MQTVNLQKAASKQKYVCEILRLTSDKCHFVTIVTHFSLVLILFITYIMHFKMFLNVNLTQINMSKLQIHVLFPHCSFPVITYSLLRIL